jgi:hypothetical protein
MRGRARALLLLLILIGFALRLLWLDAQSLWYDEGVTAVIAQRDLVELTRWTANDIQPPLYYYLVAGWGRVAGWSEWALRFPSAAFGALAIPLLAVLARRLLRLERAGVWAGLLAALLAAVHPLLVYYAQEARMYTLLVLLGLVAAYLLVRAAGRAGQRWGLWVAYVTVAAAALYTHYFAVFLLGGLGCAWLLDMWLARRAADDERHGLGAKLLPFFGANGAVLLLYLPWLANLVTRLRVDRSYWTGTLKVHEAVLDIAMSFTSGETMPEPVALWLLIGYTGVTLVAIYGLWRAWPHTRRVAIYAFFWLVIPLLAVLLLAFNVPKFNARYVMLALPALLLLWATGLTCLAPRTNRLRTFSFDPHDARAFTSPSSVSFRGPAVPWLAGLAVILLAAGGLWANYNWFLNPAFAKDHWRQITTFLRTRVAPDEQVVLVSGHAWPVWQYYAPDIPVVRLPDLEILDVDAVLDFATSGPPLIAAFDEASGKRGAWLVNWQDEVVDPNDVAPVQLELGGREKGQTATFSGLTLRRFGGIRATRLVTAPPIEHALDLAFGGEVVLRGYKVLNNGDLLLFWQRAPGATGSRDLHMALTTATADGQALAAPADRRLAGYTYPSFRWPDGAVVMGHIPAPDWLGENPQGGPVQFTLRVYDGADPSAAPLPTIEGANELTVRGVDVVID